MQIVIHCIYLNESGDRGNAVKETENPKRKWVKKNPNLTEEQKQAISQLPSKMTNRCKALMKQIICFSTENGSVDSMLAAWVKSTKPRRADWLSVLKELEMLNHPLYFELDVSSRILEANIRDYTKIIHGYAKQNMLREAEHALTAMKNRGFICDQVTLTALVHMYSKVGDSQGAQRVFDAIQLAVSSLMLGKCGIEPNDKCVALVLAAYEKENRLKEALNLLIELETNGFVLGKESSGLLVKWFQKLGVVDEVEVVLRDFALRMP
ncbi:hypothetical protein DH2020_032563 [Rehmannia glutinosa]|uniref:Pentatricopeptide repeat-containing protein n=1 Tax=Rehmannia glutinosa TaxID=99300 RepID=A0ABR0VGD9_REHGL